MPDPDTKIPLDEAIHRLSATTSQHEETLRRLQLAADSFQPRLDEHLVSIRTETQQALRNINTSLTTTLATKEATWAEVLTTMQALQQELRTLKRHVEQPAAAPPTTDQANRSRTLTLSPTPPALQPPQLDPTPATQGSTIVLPPTSALPTFSGKPSDRPRQFLLRLVEYTRTVNKWSTTTLLHGMSQFLKDSALEWYCQLSATHTLPSTWAQFEQRFLAQFHSPIRIAQQEHEWNECKQLDNETINEFIVRLRSLWLEQKPDEIETDFIRHLFCKMRPDMLTMMNATRSVSLDDLIIEAQHVEEILYLRNKEQRLRTAYRSPPSSLLSLNPRPRPSARPPTQSTPQPTITCWRCYETGHYATTCPLNDGLPHNNTTQPSHQPLPPRSKNT